MEYLFSGDVNCFFGCETAKSDFTSVAKKEMVIFMLLTPICVQVTEKNVDLKQEIHVII